MKPRTAILTCALQLTGSGAMADPVLLFTYFIDEGRDGLHLAWSEDGRRWRPLQEGRSLLAPRIGHREQLLRDPCAVRGPDGTYHLVWTSGWNENHIGYASTRDFITWSEPRAIPVMAHEPAVLNCWAPEIVHDETRGEFVIFWASTIPDRFAATADSSESGYNHRIYATTTKDFVTFTPTRLFYDPGFSVIDATFVRADGRVHLIVKDETVRPPKKHLRLVPAAGLQGPFGEPGAPFTPEGRWVEGPTAVKLGDEYLVYFEAYLESRYCVMRSRDLVHWEEITAGVEFPFAGTPRRMRHGSVITVPRELIAGLQGAGPAG